MVESGDDVSLLSEPPLASIENPITPRAIGLSFVAGLVATVAMVPVAVGIPIWLGVFKIQSSAGFGFLVGLSPTSDLAIVFFALGGTVVLPLFFVVTSTYLPPAAPSYLRGVTVSLIFWPGFVIIFWPFAGATTDAVFLVVSFVSHLLYGLVLGVGLNYLTGIPEHEV